MGKGTSAVPPRGKKESSGAQAAAREGRPSARCLAAGRATRACRTALALGLGCGVRPCNRPAALCGMSDAGRGKAERPQVPAQSGKLRGADNGFRV